LGVKGRGAEESNILRGIKSEESPIRAREKEGGEARGAILDAG